MLLSVSVPLPSQVYQKVFTAKGGSLEIAVPHSLAWWAEDPLRLDAGGDLMLGVPAKMAKSSLRGTIGLSKA